jgi:hypothetical protein
VDNEITQVLRIDRATTQYEVTHAVKQNIENIMTNPQDHRSRRRLMNILQALETPDSGPEKPRF